MDDGCFSDDYVAKLLAKDAKELSSKYSASGTGAYTSSAPPMSKPKPNTRFLRNIIRETDSHNAALLAKEAAESRARLDKMEVKGRGSGVDIRKRQLGMIAAHLKGGPIDQKRTRFDVEKRRHRDTSIEDEEKSRSRTQNTSGKTSAHRSHRDTSGKEHQSRHRSRREHTSGREKDRHRDPRSRSRSPTAERTNDHSRKSRHRHRSRQRSLSMSDSGAERRNRTYGERSNGKIHRGNSPPLPKSHPRVAKRTSSKSEDDSDPLDDVIGPRPPAMPPVRSRGRGVTSSASGIESRFATGYDPTADVALDPGEENDWDQALEALRDRQKWKQQGADRLRAAGFTEEEIGKWERGGEKKEEDVRWSTQGEGREWDRGKQFDPDTDEIIVRKRSPDVDLSFGRLKDT